MKIGLPSKKEYLQAGLLRLIFDQADKSILRFLDACPMPWKFDRATGAYLVHVSSVPWFREQLQFDGYAGEKSARYVGLYLKSLRRTFTALKIKPAKSYNWQQHFNPEEFQSKEYQLAGMEISYERSRLFGVGQLLGDDVGLGKTIQAIGLMGRWFVEGIVGRNSIAVFTASSVKTQWKDEILRFTSHPLTIGVIDGSRAERLARMAELQHVYILNYHMVLLPQYAEAMADLFDRVSVIVCDECGAIKNPEAKTTKGILAISQKVDRKLFFNATPIENGLMDMFSQLRGCEELCVGPLKPFAARYTIKSRSTGRIVAYRRIRELKLRIGNLYIRRTRDEVGEELPDAIPQIRYVEMSKNQTGAYLQAQGEFLGNDDRGVIALPRVHAMQYAAYSADMVNGYQFDSAKADDIESLLTGELSGERMVLFTRYARVADSIAKRLANFKPLIISGKVSQKLRSQARREFSIDGGKCQLLICTGAGERGLNLQAAGVVGNLDLPWNFARLRQRIGRCARIGQKRKSVLVLNWVATQFERPKAPTIDRYFIGVITPKKELFMRVFGDDGVDELGADSKEANLDVGAIRQYLRQSVVASPQ